MLYAAILHLLAGVIAGSIFKARTLLLLLCLVVAEAVCLAVVQSSIIAVWALSNVIVLQIGYAGGVFGRAALEQAGYLLPGVRTRRAP